MGERPSVDGDDDEVLLALAREHEGILDTLRAFLSPDVMRTIEKELRNGRQRKR
jgi:hypothetical protein